MARKMAEKQTKHALQRLNGIWMTRIEPGYGSDLGLPDTLCVVRGKLVPIEFKLGTISQLNSKSHLFINSMRPTQVSWHQRFHQVGGKALIIIETKDLVVWAVPGKLVHQWQSGYDIMDYRVVTRINNADDLLDALLK